MDSNVSTLISVYLFGGWRGEAEESINAEVMMPYSQFVFEGDKVKVKLSIHSMETYSGSGATAPMILDLARDGG